LQISPSLNIQAILLPVGLVKFNWVELFTLRRLMDSMQILPRTLLTKLSKSKPNMLYKALRSRVASRGILAESIVGETPTTFPAAPTLAGA
jgi:hypothetical protein